MKHPMTAQDHEDTKKLGDRIRELRLKKGHASMEKFANEYDLPRVLLSNWENGKGNITYRNLIKLTQALEVSLKEFFEPFTK